MVIAYAKLSVGNGPAFLAAAERLPQVVRGVLSKQVVAAYRPGPSRKWLAVTTERWRGDRGGTDKEQNP